MNLIDLIVLIVIALFVIYGYARGLIMTVFRFVSFFVSIALARYLHPYVSRFLRDTPLYGMLRDTVADSIGLEEMLREHAGDLLSEGGLPIPEILRRILAANNTPDIYKMLKVETIEDYIAGFFANIVINVLAIILVFIIAWLALSIVGSILDLVGRLPVINVINRAGGLAAGAVMGFAVTWAGLLILGILFATPAYPEIYAYTQGSLAAKWMFDSGFALELFTGV